MCIISEFELMVGLIIPQFQHDIIPLNSVVCLQDVNYRHDAAPVRTNNAPIHEKGDTESRDILLPQQIYAHFKAKNKNTALKDIASIDAQFNVRQRVLCTDALLVRDYARPKSLKAPLIRSFRSIINRKFSKKQTPKWRRLHDHYTTTHFKSFLKNYTKVFNDILYEKISLYTFGKSSTMIYYKPLMLTTEDSGGGSTTVLARWMEKQLPKGSQSVSQFQRGRVGLCTVIAVSFECSCTACRHCNTKDSF